MEVLDSRRLTGPNLQHPGPGAVAEVRFEAGESSENVLNKWQEALSRVLEVYGLSDETVYVRRYDGGASIGFSAPIDMLYGATEMNEWAIAWANSAVHGGTVVALDDAKPAIEAALEEERNPRMLSLQAAAAKAGLPFVWDDDIVSIGMGKRSHSWPTQSLPSVDEVAWEELAAIPVVLVTGTNGKTTSSRLIARILHQAGFAVGSTSTDGVCVNERVVEEGDWTGPGAARMVLRRPDVDVAVLETARGGLLRRGIGVDASDVSLVTNVGDDHLGAYGVNTVPEMALAKNLICSVVQSSGTRVLNADDPELSKLGHAYSSPLVWVSLNPENPIVEAHCQSGGEAWVLDSGVLTRRVGDQRVGVVDAADIPITVGGAALHNVCNALGAAAAAAALGVPNQTIAVALKSFGKQWSDNPGRCHWTKVSGVELLFDFGHNPHGIEAILGMARRVLATRPSSRLAVSIGQAGDRSDRDIQGLASSLMRAHPDLILARNIPGYERGREPGEVARILRDHLVALGMPRDGVLLCDDELQALEAGFGWARSGDLVVTLVHLQRERVKGWLQMHQV